MTVLLWVGALALLAFVGWIALGLRHETRSFTDAEKATGIHCLNGFTNSHRDFDYFVERDLPTGSYFRQDGTSIGLADANGRHKILMRYVTKDAYGQYIAGVAEGLIDSKTCNVLEFKRLL